MKYDCHNSICYNNLLRKSIPGGSHFNFHSNSHDLPIHFVSGKKSRLFDMDGNEYLDLFAKFGAMIVGHNNEKYNNDLKKCIDTVLSVGKSNIEDDVCKLIKKFVPSAEMIRFGLSGTEIIQNALRLARAYTKKNKFLRFEGHFHGSADNIMGGIARHPDSHVPENLPNDYLYTEGRAENIFKDETLLIPWNDVSILESFLERNYGDIAAIITEPICINGGNVLPITGYLEKLRELCSRYNIVLIFDEIITGFRVNPGGAQTLFGVTPDLTVLGKAMAGGGLPVSALAGKREIMKLFEERRVIHAGTFNGYTLGLAAVKATLEILSCDDGECYDVMIKNSQRIHDIMLNAASSIGIPLVIQGFPTCASFHCQEKELEVPGRISPITTLCNNILYESLAYHGILTSMPSRMFVGITLDSSDIDFFANRVEYALKDAKALIDRASKRNRVKMEEK